MAERRDETWPRNHEFEGGTRDRSNQNTDRITRLEGQVDNDRERLEKLTTAVEELTSVFNMGRGIAKFIVLLGGMAAGIAAIYASIGSLFHK